MNEIGLSIIVPVFNGANYLDALFPAIRQTLAQAAYAYEVIFVDDGSTDESNKKLQALAAGFPNVSSLRLPENSADYIAQDKGIALARGEMILVIHDDMRQQAVLIPQFVAALKQGYDLVLGRRINRPAASLMQRVASGILNVYYAAIFKIKVHDLGCGLRAFKRKLWVENQGSFWKIISQMRRYRYLEISVLQSDFQNASRYRLIKKIILFWRIIFFPVQNFFDKNYAKKSGTIYSL